MPSIAAVDPIESNRPECGCCAEVSALLHDGALYAAYLNPDGIVTVATESSAQLLGRPLSEIVGAHVSQFLPARVAQERLELIRGVLNSGEPVTVVGMLGGKFVRTTFRLTDHESWERRILATASPVAIVGRGAPAPMRVVEAAQHDWGGLSMLSLREVEVLKLIGDGLTAAEIARRLHRSPKTVNWHRCQIGEKLGAPGKLGLAEVAREAGLGSMELEELGRFLGVNSS